MDRLLDGLTDDQRFAVTVGAPRLRILAGAGTGKTRVLTRRIAHQAQGTALDPTHALALTFTRKAAGELRERLRKLGLRDDVTSGTFHAVAYAQLRARWADQNLRPPKLIDRRGQLLFRIMPKGIDRSDRLAIQTEIDWATARRITPDAYITAAERAERNVAGGAVAAPQVAEHYRLFVEEKRRRQLVDFDDLLELSIRSMADPSYAQTRHWRFRHLFVDEFQDVNPLQYQLLRSWLGPEATICVVGDPNQAIYSWNGADATYLEHFEQHFPGGQTIELRTNFRSTPQILAAATAIGGAAGRLDPTRPDGKLPTIRADDDDAAEAHSIARAVRDSHGPQGRWSHQAVLVRTNAQTALIADALRKADIPVAIRDGASVLDAPRVAARLTSMENDPRPVRTLMVDLRVEAEAGDPDDENPRLGPGELPADAAAALLALAEDQHGLQPDATIADFVTWVRATVGGGADDTSDAVALATFHASKGLEWPIVHLAGLENGLVPIAHAITPEARAEERRLFYVAVTRAQDQLKCSWARQRRFGTRTVDRQPSIFLKDMAAVADGSLTVEASTTDNLTRVRALRDQLGVQEEASAEPEVVREALRTWRLNTARANAVPAYVVFSDRTLDALVEQRPNDVETLKAIVGLGPVKIDRYGEAIIEVLAGASG